MHSKDIPLPHGFRDDLHRWRQLVPPEWLADLVAGTPVAAAPAGHWRLLEVGFGALDSYADGHIPGAGYIDTTEFESGPLWKTVGDPVLKALLQRCAIRHDTTVVLYGRNMLAAARAAHLLLYAGVDDVRLLDGGFAAWTGLAFPLERGMPAPVPAARDFGATFPAHPEYLADMREVRALLQQPGACVVSVRTWNEFIGATSGYAYIPARGDIAGARWGRAGSDGDINSMSAYHDAGGRMKPAAEIMRMWHAEGICADSHAVFYCGTGWRASLAFFYAWLMGWERIGVYPGGWGEWSRDPGNPVVCRTSASYEKFRNRLDENAAGSPVPCSPTAHRARG